VSGRLSGKVAVVTGSGGAGLGRAGARLFAAEGAQVVVLDLGEDGIKETVRLIHAEGGEAIGVQTDVTDLGAVESMVEQALGSFGRIDILWNNAAVLADRYVPAEDISTEAWEETFSVNVTGYFHCVKAIVPHMKARQAGTILNTGSLAALTAMTPGYLHYAASKAAVVQMTRWLAAELGPFNIRVNCLAGGGIQGPGGAWKEIPQMPAQSPFGGLPLRIPSVMPTTEATRWPSPAEFAYGALYLVDPAAGPLTGVVLPVDGGRTSRAFA
jgi:3-oxoacyl-[acyl-carrier protein] reductase